MGDVAGLAGRRGRLSVSCPVCFAVAGVPCSHPARAERARTAAQREQRIYEASKAEALAEGPAEIFTGTDGEPPWWVPVRPPEPSSQMLLDGVPGPTVEPPDRALGVVAEFMGRDVEDLVVIGREFIRVDLEQLWDAVRELADDYEDDETPIIHTWDGEGFAWTVCKAEDPGAIAVWVLE